MATGGIDAVSSEMLRWDLLESQLPSGERLTVRSAMPNRRKDLLIAVDAMARHHLLVEIPPGEPRDLSDRTSRGIAVQTVEMNVGGGELRAFVDVACLEQPGHAALDTIAAELADALDAGASIGRIPLVQNVLGKWRRFWSGMSQGLLSREQQLGLFGELWFMLRWLGPSIGLARATRIWRGPIGARNDFEATRLGIEVKTTSRVDSAHHINGLEQLLEPAGGALLLFSLAVRDEASASDCLPNLIAEIRQDLEAEFEALSHFDAALYTVGYEDAHVREYAKLKLRVRFEELYRVEGDFPRLIPTSLNAGIPPGVGAVSYELRLDAAAPWRLASSPTAAAQLLSDFVG